MRISQRVVRLGRVTVIMGALALGGCASNAYRYDDDPGVYYRGGAGYPPYYYGHPGYYGYPGYYARPGYFGYSPYPPRVVYHDHDHRGDDCRHPSHRDGRRGDDRDHHDRNGRDRQPQDLDGRPDRRPPGEGPATPPPQWRNPPRGVSPEGPGSPPHAQPTTNDPGAVPNKRRTSAVPRSEPKSRGMRALRIPEAKEPRKPPEERKELD